MIQHLPTLGFYAHWPVFAGIGLLMLLAATPLFRAADTPPTSQSNRLLTVDGLRGYLALAVFFQHVAVYHEFLLNTQWRTPPDRFYTLLGPVAVSLFFMITGYLFWSQLIRTEGRPPWLALYIGRVYRLIPLYLFAVAIVFLIVLTGTGPHLHVPLHTLALQVARFLTAGVVQAADLNGFNQPAGLLAYVMWTLHYEWKFYFCLPLLALFTRSPRLHLPFVVALLLFKPLLILIAGHEKPGISVLPLFLLGMLCASLKQKNLLRRPPDIIASILVLALIAAAFFAGNPIEQVLPQFLLGGVFYLIIAGCTLFGLLTMRPALRLGDVSYGIYLLQGLALAAIFRLPAIHRMDAASIPAHWLAALLSATLLISVATATHVWIERPGIARGKQMIRTLRARYPQIF